VPTTVPPIEALREFLGPTTRHTRRIEIFEQDGVTRWVNDTVNRLKSGSVTVDYDRDERRAFDLTLSNNDEMIVHAPGEFWYDKIIKFYRGVQMSAKPRQPKIVVVSDQADPNVQGQSFRAALLDQGFGDIQINTLAVDYETDLAPFDIIVALGNIDKGVLLKQAYDAGKSVFVFRESAQFFYNAVQGNTTWSGATVTASNTHTTAPRNLQDPRTVGWSQFTQIVDEIGYKAPAVALAGIFGIAYAPGGQTNYAITSAENGVGGKYIAVHFPLTAYQYMDFNFQQFLLSAINWLNPVVTLTEWEVQIGEFMIDRISAPHFPHEIQVTGRDYAKKCQLSKYTEATQYAAGHALESVVGSIAIGAGINKRLLPATGVVVGRDFFFERGTSRWDAMKEVAVAYNYELYFDAQGYLVLRQFRDPTLTAPTVYINTGIDGQIASYEKSTSDARLFNHIIVVGENSDSDIPLVWAEAKNEDPNSPTSIQEIGDRWLEYSSAFVTTTTQAQELADSYLAVSMLQEFELNFETLLMPWMEAGDILGWIDPNPAPGDPSTFLLSNFTIPMSLAPMSGTGRRVTIVGS
jgi:hypothetical protein